MSQIRCWSIVIVVGNLTDRQFMVYFQFIVLSLVFLCFLFKSNNANMNNSFIIIFIDGKWLQSNRFIQQKSFERKINLICKRQEIGYNAIDNAIPPTQHTLTHRLAIQAVFNLHTAPYRSLKARRCTNERHFRARPETKAVSSMA